MIRLKPNPEVSFQCPYCRSTLDVSGWTIPGMRALAELYCAECKRDFYGDLPSGQALFSPILLNKSTGEVYDNFNAEWFAEWLADSYAQKTSTAFDFRVKKFSKPEKKVVLLNCIDTLYGHALLKLLNAQYYIDRADVSLIILLPRFLEWLIPDGTAEAWIIDLPLRRGTEWNDWLACQIDKRLEQFEEVFLSIGFSHPHPEDFEIERFTRVKPFSLENWAQKTDSAQITFIWREDRLWETGDAESSNLLERIKKRFAKPRKRTEDQLNKVIKLAEYLRGKMPGVNFAVAGIGEPAGLPSWISDLRLTKIDDNAERAWCELYARSHVVIGVLGSNMLLPSAHAGSIIEIIGEERWGNFLQDIMFNRSDLREMFFRYRFVPHSTAPEEISRLTLSVLQYEEFRRLMSPAFCRHGEQYDFEHFRAAFRQENRIV